MRKVLIRCLNNNLSLEAYLVLDCLYNDEHTALMAYASSVKKISDNTFSKLISEKYIKYTGTGIPPKYNVDNISLTNKFEEEVLGIKNVMTFDDAFKELTDAYPSKTAEGRRLHGDLVRCRKLYQKEVMKKQVVDESVHSLLVQCTRFLVAEKRRNNSLNYLKSLSSYLNQKEWETVKDEVETIIANGGHVGKRSITTGTEENKTILRGGEFT